MGIFPLFITSFGVSGVKRIFCYSPEDFTTSFGVLERSGERTGEPKLPNYELFPIKRPTKHTELPRPTTEKRAGQQKPTVLGKITPISLCVFFASLVKLRFFFQIGD